MVKHDSEGCENMWAEWQKYLNYASLDLSQRFKNPIQKFEIYRKFLRKVENDLSFEAV